MIAPIRAEAKMRQFRHFLNDMFIELTHILSIDIGRRNRMTDISWSALRKVRFKDVLC